MHGSSQDESNEGLDLERTTSYTILRNCNSILKLCYTIRFDLLFFVGLETSLELSLDIRGYEVIVS
jgi:hypothetical protein